jgi:hypothetical protein
MGIISNGLTEFIDRRPVMIPGGSMEDVSRPDDLPAVSPSCAKRIRRDGAGRGDLLGFHARRDEEPEAVRDRTEASRERQAIIADGTRGAGQR